MGRVTGRSLPTALAVASAVPAAAAGAVTSGLAGAHVLWASGSAWDGGVAGVALAAFITAGFGAVGAALGWVVGVAAQPDEDWRRGLEEPPRVVFDSDGRPVVVDPVGHGRAEVDRRIRDGGRARDGGFDVGFDVGYLIGSDLAASRSDDDEAGRDDPDGD